MVDQTLRAENSGWCMSFYAAVSRYATSTATRSAWCRPTPTRRRASTSTRLRSMRCGTPSPLRYFPTPCVSVWSQVLPHPLPVTLKRLEMFVQPCFATLVGVRVRKPSLSEPRWRLTHEQLCVVMLCDGGGQEGRDIDCGIHFKKWCIHSHSVYYLVPWLVTEIQRQLQLFLHFENSSLLSTDLYHLCNCCLVSWFDELAP